MIISGEFSFASKGGDMYEEYDNREYILYISPRYSYFVADRFALGLSVPFAYTFQGESNVIEFGAGPHFIGYFGDKNADNAKGKIYPFIGLEALYRWSQSTTDYDPWHANSPKYTSNDHWFSAGIGVGIDIMITNSVALGPVLSFQYDIKGNYTGNIVFLGVHLKGFLY